MLYLANSTHFYVTAKLLCWLFSRYYCANCKGSLLVLPRASVILFPLMECRCFALQSLDEKSTRMCKEKEKEKKKTVLKCRGSLEYKTVTDCRYVLISPGVPPISSCRSIFPFSLPRR